MLSSDSPDDSRITDIDNPQLPLGDEFDFDAVLKFHFAKLQSTLLLQHEREVQSLKAENRILRAQLQSPTSILSETNPPDARSASKSIADSMASDAPQMNPDAKAMPRQAASSATTRSASTSLDTSRIPGVPRQKSQETSDGSPEPPEASTVAEGQDSPSNSSSMDSKDNPKSKTGTTEFSSQRPSLQKGGSHPVLSRRSTVDLSALGENPGFFKKLVLNHRFEVISGSIIILNTVMMALRLQYDAMDIGFEIGAGQFAKSGADTWPHAEDVFYYIELAFTAVFILEFLLRMGALQWRSVRCGWMWFDCIIITVGTIDIVGQGALPFNPGMLRVVRLVRLVRLLKVLKTMQSFDSLFLLEKAIIASSHAAFWSFAFLLSVQIVVGLFLNQLAQTFLLEDGRSIDAKRDVFKYYGTFSGTMLTMFEITMASWVPPCRILVDNISEYFILFFIVYRCLFCFAVLKVIAAVFITETNRVLQHDDELTLMKLRRERALFDKKVRAMVSGFAENSMNWEELTNLAYDDDVVTHLSTFGFHSQDLEKLFWLIENGTGRVSVDDFLLKIHSLKGPAKAIDMLTSLKIVHKIDHEVASVFKAQGYLDGNSEEDRIEDIVCNEMVRRPIQAEEDAEENDAVFLAAMKKEVG